MATAVATRPFVQITSRRANVAGIQYTIADGDRTHFTTFTPSGQFVSCSCGYEHYHLECAARRLAQAQEAAYALEAAKRETYLIACGIY